MRFIVTGASHGLERALATGFASECSKSESQFLFIQADVINFDQVEHMVEIACKQFGTVDVLI